MKYFINFIYVAALTILLILAMTRPAYAYIDPGTGSFFLQLLIGGILGSLFALKLFWRRISGFSIGLFSKRQEVEMDDNRENNE